MTRTIFHSAAAALISAMAVGAQTPTPTPPQTPSTREEADNQAKLASLDKMPGYAGIAFGADFQAKDFEIEQDRGALKIYRQSEEPVLIGPALVNDVLFHVFEGKFYGVAFHTNDGQDSLALKGVLVNAFGTGTDAADYGPSTIWIGKDRGALFDLNTATGEGSAFIFDHTLHNKVLTQQSKASQSAAQQLIQGKP
jgi:hypothetical protein